MWPQQGRAGPLGEGDGAAWQMGEDRGRLEARGVERGKEVSKCAIAVGKLRSRKHRDLCGQHHGSAAGALHINGFAAVIVLDSWARGGRQGC